MVGCMLIEKHDAGHDLIVDPYAFFFISSAQPSEPCQRQEPCQIAL